MINYLLIIPVGLAMVIGLYLAINRPLWLLAGYLIAVPLLPPLPVGSIELSALDLLAIPALVRIIYNFSRSGFVLRNLWVKGFFLYVLAAVISFFCFLIQTSSFSGPIFFRVLRLVEMFLPVILAAQSVVLLEKENIIRLFLVGAGLTAAAGVLMYLTGTTLRSSQTFVAEGELFARAAGTHGDSGSFGNLMGLSVVVAIGVLVYSFRKKNKKYAITAGIICLLGLLLSLSRGGIVLTAVGFAVLLVPLLSRPAKFMRAMIITALVLGVIFAIVWTQTDNRLVSLAVEDFQERVSGLGELGSDFENVSSHRNLYWEKSWEIFKSKPGAWPFGLGYKSLKLHYESLPDNNFLQAFFEMGLFGLAAFLIMILTGIIAGIKTYRVSRPEGVLILAIWIALVSNMLSADVMTYWHNIPGLFILLIAITAKTKYNETAIDGQGYIRGKKVGVLG
jgi:O-antigen ligase